MKTKDIIQHWKNKGSIDITREKDFVQLLNSVPYKSVPDGYAMPGGIFLLEESRKEMADFYNEDRMKDAIPVYFSKPIVKEEKCKKCNGQGKLEETHYTGFIMIDCPDCSVCSLPSPVKQEAESFRCEKYEDIEGDGKKCDKHCGHC